MATITTRTGKGSPLTNSEVDSNFTNINTELGQKESASNKGVANGYASLDGSGKVPSAQLPSYVDDVVEGANLAALPATGETGKIYVTLDTNKTYRWSGSAYVEISASPGSTDAVTEGSTNLYFTNARARGALSGTAPISYNSTSGAISHAVSGVTAGSYGSSTSVPVITVDATGHVTGVSTSSISGSLTFTGDVTGSGSTGSSTALTLANSGVVAGTYTKVTVDAKGRVTTGASLASGDLPTYTGTITSSQVTTALGFTPYNSSNPSGYITSSSNITGTAAGITGYTLSDVTGTATSVMTRNGSGDSAVGSRFYFTNCTADGGTFGLIGLNWGGAAGTYKDFEVYDYANSRPMFRSFGSTRNFEVYGTLTAPNFADSTGAYNVNLGSGGSEGRGLVAGYSGGSYGGIGYNVRHTTTGGSYIAPGGDTSSYLSFNGGGFTFYGAAAGAAGRSLSLTTIASINSAGTFNAVNLTNNGNQVLHAGNYSSYSLPLSGGTLTGKTTFPSAVNDRPQVPGGVLGIDTGDGNFDIWGISRDYYPSHATASSAWGIRWDGDSNQVRFIGNGTTRLAVDLDGGASALTWEGNAVLNASNYSSYALPLSGGTLTGAVYVSTNGSGSSSRALRVGPYGGSPGSFGSYTGAWRSTIEIWDNAATRMLHLTPPDGTNYNYSSIKSTDAGLKIDVGANGGTNAVTIETTGAATLTSNLTMSSGGIGSNAWSAASANETSRILAPAGAAASWDNNPVGAIKIRLPIRYNNAMWRMTVKIYDYGASVSEYHIGTYSYADGGYQSAAYFIGSNNAPVRNVRFGNDGSYDCVWIGETNTVWSYPVVAVTDFSSGFRTSAASNFMNNWHISYVTSFGTVAQNLNPFVRLASGSNIDGNTILHAGNYSSYALPLSGGTLTGTLYFADTTNGLSKAGGRLTVRSESTDDVANFASYGLYLPKSGQTAGLYVQSPIEARGGLRIGDGAGSGTISVGADTAATANRLVQRDSGGDIYGRYFFGVHFNQSSSNTENPSIAAFWTNSGSDNYNRKSSPAHVISQLGLLTTSNYGSYALPLTGGTVSGIVTARGFDGYGVGTNSGTSGDSYRWGYQEAGAWTHPYPDLVFGYHTGLKFGANTGYGGMRFYSDHPNISSTILFSIGNGDSHVRVANNLIVSGDSTGNEVYTNNWFRNNGSGGWYSQSYGYGLRFAEGEGATYGNVCTYGSGRNGWAGYGVTTSFYLMGRSGSDLGIYDLSYGWTMYTPYGSGRMSFGTSGGDASYRIYCSGSFYATGNVVAYSDRRVKENIVTIDGALDKVSRMRGVYYNRIDDEKKTRQVGVVAQEMNEVLPEAVTYGADVDEYGVSYGNIVGVLIEAIKELKSEVADLKSKLH